MSQRASSLALPNLRLAGDGGAPTPAADATARREVARENLTASINADDVRWSLARQVQDSLEGGRAALLRPEARRRLVTNASGLGLAPFDANLVIAIVQDAARHGEPLSDTASRRLSFVPVRESRASSPLMLLAAAVVLGATLLGLLISWLMG